MGGKWDEIPSFHSPPFPISRRSKIFPAIPFVKNQLTALTGGKMAFVATHGQSSPRRMMRILAGPKDFMAVVGMGCPWIIAVNTRRCRYGCPQDQGWATTQSQKAVPVAVPVAAAAAADPAGNPNRGQERPS